MAETVKIGQPCTPGRRAVPAKKDLLRRVAILATALVLSVGAVSLPNGEPAGALTETEKFVFAVYDDYLFREPTDNEVAWWNAFLSTGSRTQMVLSVLASNDFKGFWVAGMGQYYLSGTDPQLASIQATLQVTGDFVAAEVALLSGNTYFSNSGGSNTGYVSAIYQDVLMRPADVAGLNYWVGRLNNGTSTRSSVANGFIRSIEAADRRIGGLPGQTECSTIGLTSEASIQAGSYCIVLDRLASPSEIAYWSAQLAGSGQLPAFWAAMSGSVEYYDTAQMHF